MNNDFNEEKPIFLQIALLLENGILSGAYPEETQIPSITEFSVEYKINPATALKGVNILVDRGLLYKKRGLGMFVAKDARASLVKSRKDGFYAELIRPVVKEAKSLGVTVEELLEMMKRGFAEDVDRD